MRISKAVLEEILAHAQQDYPREACGLILSTAKGRQYVSCRNIAKTPSEHFIINPVDQANAEDLGEIVAVVHSHPDGNPRPSQADRLGCKNSGYPWLIVSWPDNGQQWISPDNYYQVPLLGRQFAHGILDCWTLCRDFYAREAGLLLPDYQRSDGWWETGESPSLYEDYYKDAGFYEVDKDNLRRGDMLVMQIGRSVYPNHAVIFLADNPLLTSETCTLIRGTGPFFIHHMYNQDSQRAIYGRTWADRVRLALRHKEY